MRAAWVVAGIAFMAATGVAAQSTADRHVSDSVGFSSDGATVVIEGRESVSATVSGTWSGTLTPEVSATPNCEDWRYGSAAWTAVGLYSSAGVRSATTTANGTFLITPVAGHRCARLRMSSYASGTATVVLRASAAPPVDVGAAATGATALGKAEDGLHASGDVGVMNLGVVNSPGSGTTAGTTFSETNGDYVPFATDAQGRLKLDGQFPEDSAHSNGNPGNFVLGVRNDAASMSLAQNNLDYSPFALDQVGRVFVYHDQALPAGTNNIGWVDVNSSALPTGAATEATLVAASAKLPAVLGQTTMAASLSVTVASNQSAVTVTDGAGAMNVIVDSITAGDTNIGNVDIVTMPSVTIGTFPDNEPFNLAQIGGVEVATGQGVATNALRAVLANDAPLPSGDNVIGYINGSGSAGTPNDGVMTVQGITGATAVKVTQPVGWAAPAACVIGAGAAAQAADFAVLAAVANTRLCRLQIRDTGAGTAAGVVRHAAYGANCNTGSAIGYFALGAGVVYDVIAGSRELAVASGVCVDVTAGTVDASWASVVEAAP